MSHRRDVMQALAALPVAWLGGCMGGDLRRTATRPLQVRGSLETLEIAPVLLAARHFFADGAVVRDGGIGNLVGVPRLATLGDEERADVATHAETQALRYSLANPELRIILTVTQGRYRIVARRSAGIAALADLSGKRVATLPTTSAGFFLARMLKQVGLGFDAVAIARILPIAQMAPALARGEVDAIAIWEPHAGNALQLLGTDAISFSGDGVYRELFNLNSTVGNLADPKLRPRIVGFVRAVVAACQAMRRDPMQAQRLVAATGGFTPDEVARSWPTLDFTASLPGDLLDVLTAEEQWLAAQDNRLTRGRGTLRELIDGSVWAEANRGSRGASTSVR
jgi:sulfonate transport system substrate-binding protein